MSLITAEESETLKKALEIAKRIKDGGHKGNSKIALSALHATSALSRLIEKIEEGAE